MRIAQLFIGILLSISLLCTQSAYTSSARVTPAAPETVVLDMPITRKELVYATSTWVPAEHASGVTCAICLEDFRRGDDVIIALCHKGHSLHARCALDQLQQTDSMRCAQCRIVFLPAPLTDAEYSRRDRKSCCKLLSVGCLCLAIAELVFFAATDKI